MIRLIQGDCIEEMNKLIDNDIKVDMVLTDPPYGTTACKWDNIIPLMMTESEIIKKTLEAKDMLIEYIKTLETFNNKV